MEGFFVVMMEANPDVYRFWLALPTSVIPAKAGIQR